MIDTVARRGELHASCGHNINTTHYKTRQRNVGLIVCIQDLRESLHSPLGLG